MSGKITAMFNNQSGKVIMITIFEVVKNAEGKEQGRIVFTGGIPPRGYRAVELDNTIMPWASLAEAGHKLDAFLDWSQIKAFQLDAFDGGRYNVDYWS
jgi:hypothetical protein